MRKPEQFEVDALREVASWFYGAHESRPDILKKLQARTEKPLEIRLVDRMLAQARARGVVVIEFPEKPSPERQLEIELIERFPHLQKVIIVPLRENEDYPDMLDRWGRAAARYFDDLVVEGDPDGKPIHVGISGGETLLAFVNAVEDRPRRHVHIHTTALIGHGQLPKGSSHVDPVVNATLLWSKCGREPGHCHYATVPPYADLRRQGIQGELQRLSKRQPILDVIEGMNDITVAFAGLGVIKPENGTDPRRINQLTMTGLLEDIVPAATLLAERAIGDLSYCLFNREGITFPKWEFFLTAGYGNETKEGLKFYQSMVDDKKRIKHVVVIAGRHKRPVLLPSLKAHLFNVWITDDASARWVLSQDEA